MIAEAILNAVGTGVQAFQNASNRRFEQEEAQKQRDWNEAMSVKQNAWNLEQWNRENEYNTPAAQVQRLRDAGLNPLYYGLDGNSAGASPTAAQPLGYDRASIPNMDNPMAFGLDSALKLAQVRNVQADTERKQAETQVTSAKLPYEVDLLKSQIRNSNLSSDAQAIINKYIDRQQEAELRMKSASAAQAEKSVEKMAGELEKMDFEKTTMFISWIETNEKILNLQKQRALTDKQLQELDSLIRKNDAEAKKIGLDVSNYDDITVLGTASVNMKFGPVSVAQGEPITLAMKKAAREHAEKLRREQEIKSKEPKSDDFREQSWHKLYESGQ